MKAILARLGIRGFNPTLKNTVEKLQDLRTPEGEPIVPNTLSIERAPRDKRNINRLLSARVIGLGIETADMLVQEVLSRPSVVPEGVVLSPAH